MKHRRTACLSCYVVLCLLAASPLFAINETQRIQRLEMLADLWGKLYLFHPRIVTTEVDWDRALLETIPKVEKAANTDDLVNALNDSLFAPLDDPFLQAQKREPMPPRPPMREMSARKISAAVGYLDATDPRAYGKDSARQVRELVKGLGAIQTLIVDLRFPAPVGANLDWLRLFLDGPQTGGVYVTREHQGWNEDNSPNVYRQAWKVSAGTALNAFEAGQSLQLPTVFVVNTNSYSRAANLLDCVQAAGRSVVMLERLGRFPSSAGAEQYPEDIEVWLQPSMLLSKLGNLGPQADYLTGEPIREIDLISVGQKLLDARRPAPRHPFSFQLKFPPRASAPSGSISRENRLLGLFKLWTVISYMDLHVQYA